jgi:hypothetical protein
MTDFRAGVREDPALVHRHSSESGGMDFLSILAPFFHSHGTTVIRNDGQILQKCFFISRTCKLAGHHILRAQTQKSSWTSFIHLEVGRYRCHSHIVYHGNII